MTKKKLISLILSLLLYLPAAIKADDSITKENANEKLIDCSIQGKLDCVQEALSKGADVNTEIYGANTALMLASFKAQTEVVKLLIGKGAKVNAKNKDGNTALTRASASFENTTEIVKLLIAKGAEVNVKGKYGWTALIWASHNSHTEIVQILINHGADVNIVNDDGNTALMSAEKLEISKLLIEKGADIRLKNKEGKTALMYVSSSYKNTTETVKFLIAKGAEINAKNKDGETALIKALRYSNLEAARLLLENGADVYIRDKNNKEGFDYTILSRDYTIYNYLSSEPNLYKTQRSNFKNYIYFFKLFHALYFFSQEERNNLLSLLKDRYNKHLSSTDNTEKKLCISTILFFIDESIEKENASPQREVDEFINFKKIFSEITYPDVPNTALKGIHPEFSYLTAIYYSKILNYSLIDFFLRQAYKNSSNVLNKIKENTSVFDFYLYNAKQRKNSLYFQEELKKKTPNILIQNGHTDYVNNLSFSPDGKTLATASSDNTAKIWSIEGKLLRTLIGHAGSVESVIFSPDGKTLATASNDNTVRIWSVEGKLLHKLIGHTGSVKSVVFSPDGKTLTSNSGDNTAIIWSSNGKLLHTGKVKVVQKSQAIFSPDGKTRVSISDHKTAKIWSVDGKLLHTLTGHTGFIKSIVFSPDGKTLATASTDETAKIWSVEGKLLYTLKGHTDKINSINYSSDWKTLVTSSTDNIVKIWSVEGKLLHTLKGHTGWINHIAYSPDGKTFATASSDQSVIIWSIEGKILHTLRSSLSANHVAFSPDGKTLTIASSMGEIWSTEGKSLHRLRDHFSTINQVSYSPDGKALATASSDNTAKIWSVDGKLLHTLTEHTGSVESIVFSPDGKTLATASTDKTAKIWSSEGELLHTLKGHTDWIKYAAFTPDSKTLITVSIDGTAKFWSCRDASLIRSISILGTIIKVDTNKKLLLTKESSAGKIHFYNYETGQHLLSQMLSDNGESLSYTPDGRFDYTDEKVKEFVSYQVAGKFLDLPDMEEHYRVPDLFEKVLKGEIKPRDEVAIVEMVEDLPEVKIHYPGTEDLVKDEQSEMMFEVKGKTRVARVEVYVNGNKVDTSKTEREEDPYGESKDLQKHFSMRVNVNLLPGNNDIKILAYNEYNIPSPKTMEIVRQIPEKVKPPKLFVLSIGVNEYSKDPARNLTYSVPDAEAIAEAFQKQKDAGLYSEVEVKLLTYKDKNNRPTRENILKALDEIIQKAHASDVVTIYYSGHGMSANFGGKSLFYLLPEDFDWSLNPESAITAKNSGVDADLIGDKLAQIRSQKVVLIIDACHSGNVGVALASRSDDKKEETKRGLKRLANGSGRYIFTSSAGDEKSRESKELGHGLYTYVLLNALGYKTREKKEDAANLVEKDGMISMSELGAYIQSKFAEQTKPFLQDVIQTPLPMQSLGRYGYSSRVNDFPLVKVGE
ncbi:MAG: ankyrin repeat domain-containing protein [Leptospiraceae bacterium]|nr:ankyrin repeat domain-containing protein [Leptospiraceae bacterium]MCP5501325.1 ankyrin repeat domain-containing protein [Leptospiraceae bacterium]